MESKKTITVALAGNPNVGKSTVFNNLTGLKQHTGNWTGKTVENAFGKCIYEKNEYTIIDLPGTYSLIAKSCEEETASEYLCFNSPDVVIVVADSTCLERNLNLLLQILELCNNVILCLNLMDEAEKKQIHVNIHDLSHTLNIPIVAISANKKKETYKLLDAVADLIFKAEHSSPTLKTADGNIAKSEKNPALATPLKVTYSNIVENAISLIEPVINTTISLNKNTTINSRFLALKALSGESNIIKKADKILHINLFSNQSFTKKLADAKNILKKNGINDEFEFTEEVVKTLVKTSESIAKNSVTYKNLNYQQRDLKIDRILTSKLFGIPIMLALLGIIFFITIQLANYPSQWLSYLFLKLEHLLNRFLTLIHLPKTISLPFMEGVYRTTAWVISVMFPPMAIFFPLFTLLEDLGYLPRIAFNLDRPFKKCGCCGKQSLTMCMGFGCNAAAVVGTKIIESKKERLNAIITNSLVPCNGRFPTLITISGVMVTGIFAGGFAINSLFKGVFSTLVVTLAVLIGVLATFIVSYFLSKTVLKNTSTSFNLELPPFRKPQIRKVLVRSLLDRTIKVLFRAIIIAAPAGLIIWILANVNVNETSLLAYVVRFLDPLARLMGLDGYILTAFILGFPANEIVLPIAVMSYSAAENIGEIQGISALSALLKANGWTMLTAVNTMIFCLFHFPCATTVLSIKKETKSIKWTLLSIAIPTVLGVFLCMLTTFLVKLFLLF